MKILVVDQKNNTNSSLKKLLAISGLDLDQISFINCTIYSSTSRMNELALKISNYSYVISTGAISAWAVGQCRSISNQDSILHIPLIYAGSHYQVPDDSYLFESMLNELKKLKEVIDVAQKNTLSVME